MVTSEDNNIYADLSALLSNAFPKRCPNCGEIYMDVDEFIARTAELKHHSGLKESEDDDGSTLVELYRNCVCGSTLLDFFNDRRDRSQQGARRREAFGRLLQKIISRGIDEKTARRELLQVLHNGRSPLIVQLLNQERQTEL